MSVQKRHASIVEFYNPERTQYDGGRIIEKFETGIEKDKASSAEQREASNEGRDFSNDLY